MSRYTGPITKLSRRLGIMLFTNGQSKSKAFQKKNYKPGEHGQKRFRQSSEYNKQLQEKQKARFMYGISEKQCRKYYELANKSDEVTGTQFLKLLEQRLDNVVYRAGFAATRPQARQIVSHGIVMVNGKKVKTPSILVSAGDKIEVRENKKKSQLFEEAKNSKVKTPKWLKSELKSLSAEVIALPDSQDIERAINSQLITEYYSK
ncbi:30S ribosomal protein S4 [Candidatus Peregrinibacteria bacterium HGW-Peregrinibacteria-1]|jgi:small subunit ribosomal protein S4|nr:MAG: 30S ribosomal protein S4 [Candidatus Peregrinibacteria bacterium HGW-Peregrinibacteria-1]